jgi:pimeloyl-ACP methyl ester carboxylesterase
MEKNAPLLEIEKQISSVQAPTLYAESKGRKIAYRSVGTGMPLILCCRFRGNLDTWDPAFLDALAENYQVITFDYSGFGLSTGNPPTNIMEFAADVTDLAEALGFEKIIMGGWSFGGFVAQIVTTEFPELVSHTILMGTRPPGKNEYVMEQIFLDTAYKPVNDLEDEIILFFEPISQASKEAAKLSHDRIFSRTNDLDIPIPMSLWAHYGMGLQDFENDPYQAREKLTQTHIPILVISPDHEVCFPPENWFALNRQLPTTQMIVIPRSGHGVQHQYPEMVANYIKNFIGQFN